MKLLTQFSPSPSALLDAVVSNDKINLPFYVTHELELFTDKNYEITLTVTLNAFHSCESYNS